MNGNVRKLVGHLPEMRVEPFVSASVFPGRTNFLHGIAEYRAEPMLNGNRIAEFAFDGIDARSQNDAPRTKRPKIRDFHRAHSHSIEEGERISSVYGAGGIDLRQALERGLGYAVMHHFFKFNYTIANLPNLKIGPVWIQHAIQVF